MNLKYISNVSVLSIAIMILGGCNPSADSNSDAWSDLKESNAGYSSWHLVELEEGGPYKIEYKGLSLAVAIEEMQNHGIITARWVTGKEHLLNKFYDIDLGADSWQTKHDIGLAFYSWVNQHFALTIGEEEVLMEASYLIIPSNTALINESEEQEFSWSTEVVGDEFGVLFRGCRQDELSHWLTKNAKQVILSKETSDTRYSFFLPCFPAHEQTVLEGLERIGIQLEETTATINTVVIKNTN